MDIERVRSLNEMGRDLLWADLITRGVIDWRKVCDENGEACTSQADALLFGVVGSEGDGILDRALNNSLALLGDPKRTYIPSRDLPVKIAKD